MAFTGYSNNRNQNAHVAEYYATGSGAMLEALALERNCVIREVRLHLSGAATQESFSVDLDHRAGAAYDTNLLTVDMSEDAGGTAGVVTDVVWRPEQPVRIDDGSEVDFSWANTDALTWGLTVIVEKSA